MYEEYLLCGSSCGPLNVCCTVIVNDIVECYLYM